MPDQIRTRAEILALLADNSVGAISPQDIRDAIVSQSVYGSIYTEDGTVEQMDIDQADVKLTGFTANGVLVSGMSPDHTQDQIVIDFEGEYVVFYHCSFEGSGGTEFLFTLYRNGAPTNIKGDRKLGSGGDVGSVSFFGDASFDAGDALDMRVRTDGNNHDITPRQMRLFVAKLG